MAKSGSELSQKQLRAISALITAPTIADAAWQADVSTRTVDRWLTQPAFQAELRLARSRVFCHAFGHLQQVASRAVAALDRVMHDNNASPASRVSAARAALRFACHGIEIADFEERLAALEHPGAGNGEDQDEAGQESDQELEEEEAREREQELADWANGKPSTNPSTYEACHEEPGKKRSEQKEEARDSSRPPATRHVQERGRGQFPSACDAPCPGTPKTETVPRPEQRGPEEKLPEEGEA